LADFLESIRETELVAETADWKQKYRDSLLEMESEEKRWQQVEQILRRLIGRLCTAGMGVNPQLDDELSALAAANRRNAPAGDLARLGDSLHTRVVAVDAVAPIATGTFKTDGIRTRAALTALLKRYITDGGDAPAANKLIGEMAASLGDEALGKVISRVADLIHERGEWLARERLQAAAVLAQVTERLEEMANYLTDSSSANQLGFSDSQAHNRIVIDQVRELTAEVSAATELTSLQQRVNARLESVAQQVSDFRAREEQRLAEYDARAGRMRARIASLEGETRDLQSRLANESVASRVDSLTGAANRKAFDERIAQELANGLNRAPITLLLWDLDSFKNINDSYGHRAGDRVLQSVAAALMQNLRADDLLARIGGEEFILLLSGFDLDAATKAAEAMRQAVESLRFHFRGTPVRVTASCGLTELAPGDAGDSAFNRADAALYKAKHAGRNQCVASAYATAEVTA
jgi:diguanylate cyclase